VKNGKKDSRMRDIGGFVIFLGDAMHARVFVSRAGF
jgi:hypothetical protein